MIDKVSSLIQSAPPEPIAIYSSPLPQLIPEPSNKPKVVSSGNVDIYSYQRFGDLQRRKFHRMRRA